MSIGQRLEDDEILEVSAYELYSILGAGDTPRLFNETYRVDTDHDVAIGGGNSVDRKTKYIDRTLYGDVMAGKCAATGLTPQQIIDRWLDHEHCEKCIVDGDNGVDTYQPGHKRALRREHEGVLAILGMDRAKAKVANYEAVIWPGLVACYKRPVIRPPKDLWCGPLHDSPTKRDEEILRDMVRIGVDDAGKRSKYEVHYGFGEYPCSDCRNWGAEKFSQEGGKLAPCRITSGLVRSDRHCDFYIARAGGETHQQSRRARELHAARTRS